MLIFGSGPWLLALGLLAMARKAVDEAAWAELAKYQEDKLDPKQFEADEVLLPPSEEDMDGYEGGRQPFSDPRDYFVQREEADFAGMIGGMMGIDPNMMVMDGGQVEHDAWLYSLLRTADRRPTSIDPSILAASLLSSTTASSSTTSATSSFSYSFESESPSVDARFATSASQPATTNSIITDTNRRQAFHGKNDTTYTIGALVPLTINGTGLLSGVQFAESFKCAINIINSNSRILRNTLLTWLVQDTEALPSFATNQALLLARRQLSMVIGPFEYDSLPPVANLYNNVSLPFISYGASGVQYSNGTVYPSFFRTIPSDLNTARAMAETMRLFGWNFVAAIFTTDSYGQSGRAALLQQIGRQRLKVTCVNQIDPGSVRGLANFADCVAQSDASVVVLWMDETNAANTLSYLYRNATNSRLTFMAPDRWALINNPASFNDTLPRTNYSFPLSYIDGTLGFVPQIGSLSLYHACMSAVTPNNTNYPAFNQVWQREFRCIINASDTVPLCPDNIQDRVFNCRCTGEESLNDLPVNPKVNYIIDSVNVFANTLDRMINRCDTFQKGTFCNRSIIASSDILFAIPQLSFQGLTGVIAYNQTRPDRRRSFLDLYQYNSEAIPHQVGFWNLSGPFYSQSLLVFKTYPEIPVSILVPENTDFGTSFWTSLVCILSGIGVLCAIFLICFFTIFSSSRVVRRTNYWFICTFLVGIALVFASLVIWTMPQGTFTCVSKTICGMIGFGLIVGCLLAKCQRYFRVFANFGYISAVMTTGEFFFWASIPLLFSAVLMVLYIVGNGVPQAVVTQSTVDNTYVFISCLPGSVSWGNWIVGIFMGIMAIFVIVCAAVLILTLHLVTPYKESTFLLLICLDFIVLLALLIPLYYTVGDRRGSALQTYLLRSLGELFAMFLTMGLLFVPKLIYVLRGVKEGERADNDDEETYGGGATTGTSAMRQDTDMSRFDISNVPNYAEQSDSDESEDGDFGDTGYATGGAGGTTGDSSGGRPQFMSMNISRGSTTMGTDTSAGSANNRF